MIISKLLAVYNANKKRFHTPYIPKRCCPICQNVVKVRDSKKRWCKLKEGIKVIFQLRRYRCGSCKKILTEFPAQVIPYKKHETNIIQDVMESSKVPADCPAEESTIRRWRKFFSAKFDDVSIDIKALRASCVRWLPVIIREIYRECKKTHPECVYTGAGAG